VGYDHAMGQVRATVRHRWARVPVWVRWVLAVYMIGFAEATGDHVVWMTHGGIHAYAQFGSILIQVFFVALIILDPLVVVLAGLVRREAVYLAVAVTVLDLTANWTASWPRVPWLFIVDGVLVFATALPLLRAMPGGSRVLWRAADSRHKPVGSQARSLDEV
jgi:hypothetical protein